MSAEASVAPHGAPNLPTPLYETPDLPPNLDMSSLTTSADQNVGNGHVSPPGHSVVDTERLRQSSEETGTSEPMEEEQEDAEMASISVSDEDSLPEHGQATAPNEHNGSHQPAPGSNLVGEDVTSDATGEDPDSDDDAGEDMEDEVSSEEEEDHDEPIPEDDSVPSAVEMLEIESQPYKRGDDHLHWQDKFFDDLEDPEHLPVASGNIRLTIENFRQTKKGKGKKGLVMSPHVQAGGYNWQLKVYPRGNGTDGMSVYVHCSKEGTSNEAEANSSKASTEPLPGSSLGILRSMQPESEDKRWEVPVQFGVVAYNPAEPSVNFDQRSQKRFTSENPDCGWPSFCVSSRQMCTRSSTHRRPLVYRDRLQVDLYFQIIQDDTESLWSNSRSRDVAKCNSVTGLRGLHSGSGRIGKRKSNVTSALMSWLLLAPLQDLVFEMAEATKTEHSRGVFITLKALLADYFHDRTLWAPLSVEPFLESWQHSGFYASPNIDVIEFWEIFRRMLDKEAVKAGLQGKLADLFDGAIETRHVSFLGAVGDATDRRRLSAGLQESLKIPVQGVGSVQVGLSNMLNGGVGVRRTISKLPKLLQIELNRQEFDSHDRLWKKLQDKVEITDELDLSPWATESQVSAKYVLYGIILHKGSLHPGCFSTVLRPGGLQGRWLAFNDDQDGRSLEILTRKEAVLKCQGQDRGQEQDNDRGLAYIVLYVRKDASDEVLRNGRSQRTLHMGEVLKQSKPAATAPGQEAGQDTKPAIQSSPKSKSRRMRVHHLGELGRGPGLADPNSGSLFKTPVSYSYFIDVVCHDKEPIWAIQQKISNQHAQKVALAQYQLWPLRTPSDFLDRAFGGEHSYPLSSTSHLHHEMSVDQPMNVFLQVVPEEYLPRKTSAAVPALEDHGDETHDVRVDEPPQSPTPEAPNTGNPGQGGPLQPGISPAPAEVAEPTHPNSATPTENARESSDNNISGQSISRLEKISNFLYERTVFFFIKAFDTSAQSYSGLWSCTAWKSHEVETTLKKCLGVEQDVMVHIWQENVQEGVLKPIEKWETFEKIKLRNLAVLTVGRQLDPEKLCRLRDEGKFSNAQDYHNFLQDRCNYPDSLNGLTSREYFGGEYFSGMRRYGRPHGGPSVRVYRNGDKYVGDFASGKRHGRGTMNFQNGNVYTGEWYEDKMQGQGKLDYSRTGNVYEGEFRSGRRHGKGTMRYVVSEVEQDLCQICYECEIDCLFYKCGHVCSCMDCSKDLKLCPVCREKVVSVVRMYKT